MSKGRKVILGVAESDAHVVANHLIAYQLRAQGFAVVNLGACTPVDEFAEAAEQNRDAEAILIGSLNGHAYDDLLGIGAAKAAGRIHCPVYVGGNLSVGADKSVDLSRRFGEIGIDAVLASFQDILSALNSRKLFRGVS